MLFPPRQSLSRLITGLPVPPLRLPTPALEAKTLRLISPRPLSRHRFRHRGNKLAYKSESHHSAFRVLRTPSPLKGSLRHFLPRSIHEVTTVPVRRVPS